MLRVSKLVLTMAAALTLLVCAFSGLVLAATIPQTTEQLVHNSSDVVRGNVISQKSQWDETHRFIYTEIQVKVTETVRGSLPKEGTIRVYAPGGVVNDTGLKVEHAPEFTNGEDVLLFLVENNGLYGVTSWEMGKFTVVNGNVREKNLPVVDFVNEIKAIK